MINRDSRIFVCVDSGETSDVDIEGMIETPNDVHAGEIETSTSLATRPHLVHPALAEKLIPRFSSRYLNFTSKRGVSWHAFTKRISPSGVMGDPTKASAEKGERMWEAMIGTAPGGSAALTRRSTRDGRGFTGAAGENGVGIGDGFDQGNCMIRNAVAPATLLGLSLKLLSREGTTDGRDGCDRPSLSPSLWVNEESFSGASLRSTRRRCRRRAGRRDVVRLVNSLDQDTEERQDGRSHPAGARRVSIPPPTSGGDREPPGSTPTPTPRPVRVMPPAERVQLPAGDQRSRPSRLLQGENRENDDLVPAGSSRRLSRGQSDRSSSFDEEGPTDDDGSEGSDADRFRS
jgi:hypothetical protein